MNSSFSFRAVVLCAAFVAAMGARLDAKIGALGRIIPAGDVINLPGAGDAVSAILVKEGDVVEAGAPLIAFRSRDSAQNEVNLAELSLKEARDLGQRTIESLTIKAEIAKRDYEFAKLRYERFSKLGGEDISAQQMEMREYQMKSAELAHQAAEKDLARAKEEREIKIDRANTQLAVSQDKLARATLTSPAKLTVIKLYAVPGVVPNGVAVTLGNLSEMHVVTEVFAGDLSTLKLGQEATITSTALPGPVKARLISIGRLINGRAKVAEVLLKLDDVTAASKLVNLEVNVSIEN